MDLKNYFRQIPTLHSRDFCPTRGPSDDTKFWARGTPNFGMFDGEVETLTPMALPLFTFRGKSSYPVRGTEGPYLPAKTRDPPGYPSAPKFLPLKFFSTMGRRFWALLELYSSDLHSYNVFRLRLDRPRELWSFRR